MHSSFFGMVGTLLLYAILRLQRSLVLSRLLDHPMMLNLATNTAVSFATTATWQAYGGETTLRYLTQIVGLVSQNFPCGRFRTGARGRLRPSFARTAPIPLGTSGSIWCDPFFGSSYHYRLVGSLLLVWQGVPLNFAPLHRGPYL